MDIESHMVSETMNEISSQRGAFQILAVGIDIVRRNLLQAHFVFGRTEHDTGLDGRNRGFLRSEDDLIQLALSSSELAVYRNRSRNVAGVHRAFRRDVHQNEFASVHAPPIL